MRAQDETQAQRFLSRTAYTREFAAYYDRITAHKDYRGEAEALVRFIREELDEPAPRILDVGCGTGTHATLLSRLGYDVVGIDVSPDMVDAARRKEPDLAVARVRVEHLRSEGFDFCYSVYNVVNCLDSLDALRSFSKGIFDRLNAGGALLVEAWNPIAVVAEPPTRVERRYEDEDETIVRTVVPEANFPKQRLDLHYHIDVYRTNGTQRPVTSFAVVHELLLFTPLEIASCLRSVGFRELRVLTSLPELQPAGEHDRMLAFVCRK